MKKLKAFGRLATIPALLLGTAIAPFLSVGVTHALAGTTYKWTGNCATFAAGSPANCTSTNLDWSQPGNWIVSTDGGATYPNPTTSTSAAPSSTDNGGSGDNIVFDNTVLTGDITTTQDIASLKVEHFTTIGTNGGDNDYTVGGTQNITVTGGVDGSTGPQLRVNVPVVFNGTQSVGVTNFSAAAGFVGGVTVASGTISYYTSMYTTDLTVASGATLVLTQYSSINDTVSGAGTIVVATPLGAGSNNSNQLNLYETGTPNTFSGTFDVQKGAELDVYGNNPANNLGTASLTIENGGQLYLYMTPTNATEAGTVTIANPMTIAGNGAGATHMNQGAIMAGMYDSAKHGIDGTLAVNLTGAVTLTGDTTLASIYSTATTYNFTGAFNQAGHSLSSVAISQPAYGQAIIQVNGVTVASSTGTPPKAPASPDTGFALVSSKVAPVLATSVAAAVGLLWAARRAKPVRR